jgi:hypothetical protein
MKTYLTIQYRRYRFPVKRDMQYSGTDSTAVAEGYDARNAQVPNVTSHAAILSIAVLGMRVNSGHEEGAGVHPCL